MKRKEIKERAETFGAKFEGGKVNGTVTMNRHDFENLIMAVQIYISSKEREECAVIAFNAKTYIKAANAIRARGIGKKYAQED